MTPSDIAKLIKERGSISIHDKLLKQIDTLKPEIVGLGEIDHCNSFVPKIISALAKHLSERDFRVAALELRADFDDMVLEFNTTGDLEALGNSICPRIQNVQNETHRCMWCKNRFVLDHAQDENKPGLIDEYSSMLARLKAEGLQVTCVDKPRASAADRDEFMAGRLDLIEKRSVWHGGARHMRRVGGQTSSARELSKRHIYTIAALSRLTEYPFGTPSVETTELESILNELDKAYAVSLADVPELKGVTVYKSGGEDQQFGFWDAVILYPS